MSQAILEASQITKFFHEPEEFKVLDNVGFQVSKGEFLALMGKSGCGKSTLLYILSTMDTDFEGELSIIGQDVKKFSKDRLACFRNEHIGFVFQFHYLLPEFTVLQNVMTPALKLGKYSPQEIEYRAYEKLKLLDVQNQALKQSSKLSGGQQQRVAIARALVNDPSIIMGDEPTGNLDSANTQIVLEIFKELSQTLKQTIIAVTHDEQFAKSSDRIVTLSDGQIVSDQRVQS